MEKMENLSCKIPIYFDDLVVRNHVLFGERILPGATYFDLIFRYLEKKGFELSKIKIRNWVGLKPIIVREGVDKNLYLSFIKNKDHWVVTGKSKKVINGIVDIEEDNNFTAEVWEIDEGEQTHIDITSLKNHARKRINMEEYYAAARERKLVHGEFMKAQGEVFSGEEYILSELSLYEINEENFGKYIYHPAFVDASFFTLSTFLLDGTSSINIPKDSVSIPLFLKEFIPLKKIEHNKLYVYMKKEDVHPTERQGIFRCNLYYFNEDGDLLASLIGYSTKEIREAKMLTMDNMSNVDLFKQHYVHEYNAKADVSYHNKEEIVVMLKELIATRLKVEPDKINMEAEFFELGLDSGDLLELVGVLESNLGIELYPTILIEYNSIHSLANYLYKTVILKE